MTDDSHWLFVTPIYVDIVFNYFLWLRLLSEKNALSVRFFSISRRFLVSILEHCNYGKCLKHQAKNNHNLKISFQHILSSVRNVTLVFRAVEKVLLTAKNKKTLENQNDNTYTKKFPISEYANISSKEVYVEDEHMKGENTP